MFKKALYLSIISPSESGVGVSSKIYKQMECFKQNGYEIKHFLYNMNKDGFSKITCHFSWNNREQNSLLINACKDVGILYIRYFFSDYNFTALLKKLKQCYPSMKIFVEIPTYPYDGEYSKFSFSLLIDKLNRQKLYKYVDRIVTYSNDSQIYKIPAINISNAVDVNSLRQRKTGLSSLEINIIMVAQMAFWHGYDRVINGLKQYYENNGVENIKLHLVGDGDQSVLDEYKSLSDNDVLKDHVVFHGRKSGDDLDEIYDKCCLAMDSMGRHRTGVYYNSTLKGKEYLAKGLPIISGVETELDNMDFEYYLRVPADDSILNFNDIVHFYHKIYDDENERVIADKIRDFCASHFGFEKTFEPVLKSIQM